MDWHVVPLWGTEDQPTLRWVLNTLITLTDYRFPFRDFRGNISDSELVSWICLCYLLLISCSLHVLEVKTLFVCGLAELS